MELEEIRDLLGLENFTTDEALDTLKSRRRQLEEKQATAPTEALKAKFGQMLDKLNEAEKGLLANTAPVSQSQSPLTETKMADLPGSLPLGSQGDMGAGQGLQLKPGDILAGRYEIKEQIGAGGMGAVYRAHDSNRDEDIAIKALLPGLTAHERARERFLDEARLSSQLSHPNIVNVYDVQHEGELFFLTMELLEGQDLRGYLDNLKTLRQQVPIDEALRIVGELSEALKYAHEHTVHRDIKPENIWLTDGGKVKLMDFGIARLMSTSQRTQTGTAMGTAYYMAPEQLQGRSDIDGRADQYALAVLLYEMLSGEVPAGRIESLNRLRKDTPRALSQAVDKALSSKADERFTDITQFHDALTKKARGIAVPNVVSDNLGMVAGVVLAVVALGGVAASGVFSGSLGELIENLRPVSEEELAQQKADAVQLKGQLKSVKQLIEEDRRNLARDLKEAERERSDRLDALQTWSQAVESVLFKGGVWTVLQGDEAVADSLLQDREYQKAEAQYRELLNDYERLAREFKAAGRMQFARGEMNRAMSAYSSLLARYGVPESAQAEATQEIEFMFSDIESQLIPNGAFEEVNQRYDEIQDRYNTLIKAVTPVATVKGRADSSRDSWVAYKREHRLDAGAEQQADSLLQEAKLKLTTDPADFAAAITLYEKAQTGYEQLLSAGKRRVASAQAAERERQRQLAAERERQRQEAERNKKEKELLAKVPEARREIRSFIKSYHEHSKRKYTDFMKILDEDWTEDVGIYDCQLSYVHGSNYVREYRSSGDLISQDLNDYEHDVSLAGIRKIEQSGDNAFKIIGISNFVKSDSKISRSNYVYMYLNLDRASSSEKEYFIENLLLLAEAAKIKGCKSAF